MDSQNPDNQTLPNSDEAAFLSQALKRRSESWTAEEDQRSQALEDINFCHREQSQWDDYSKATRKDRPKYEINKVLQAVRQVLGNMRKSQFSSKVRPSGGEATQEMADVFNGLIRNIENDSNFENVTQVAGKEAITGGFGAWQIVTDYNDDDSFEQSIKIKPIHSATTSVYFDSASSDEHHRDAQYAFVDQEISKIEFEQKYGKSTPQSSISKEEYSSNNNWSERETIRISDYWVKIPVKKQIAELSTGEVVDYDDDFKKIEDELTLNDIVVKRTRSVKSHKVQHYKISADKILDGPNDWAGKYIPIVPVYGTQIWIDGQHYYSGMVRFSKDAQRIYNYTTSFKIEQAANSIFTDRPVVTKRMLAGNEKYWNSNRPGEPIVVNPDPRMPGGIPVRLGSTAVNSALVEQTYQADQDVQATTGIYAQSLGNNPREQSGIALQTQQQRGDNGAFEMMDSVARAVQYSTEILIDLLPKIYDTERQERIIHDDGTSKFVPINKEVIDRQTNEPVIYNDLATGKYDVVSSVGPSFKTAREEAANKMAFMMQTAPNVTPLLLDIWAKNLDIPDSEEISKRLRKPMIEQGIATPTEEEKKEMEEAANTPQAQMQAQLQSKLQELQLKTVEAESRLKAAEAFTAEQELKQGKVMFTQELQQAEADIDKTESETVKNLTLAEKQERETISAK